MTVTTSIKVDLLQQNVIPVIWAKTGDSNSRYLSITVTTNGVTQIIPINAIVTFAAKRSDGTAKSFSGNVTADGTALVLIPDWLLEIEGLAECQLTIKESCCVLTTLNFQMFIQESTYTNSGVIVYYLTGSTLNPGTYTIYLGNTPYTFKTSEIAPAGSVIVFNDDYTSAIIYQDATLQAIAESGITVTQEASGTELPNDDLFNRMLSAVAGFDSNLSAIKADIAAETEARISADEALQEKITADIQERIDGLTDNIQVVKGSVDYSAIQKMPASVQNTALSEGSVALGASNISGCNAWFWRAYDTLTNTLYLTASQPASEEPVVGEGASYNETGSWGISVGNKLSVVNDSHYDQAIVTAVNGNAITVSTALFSTVKADIGRDRYCVVNLSNPSFGILSIGQGSVSGGLNNKAPQIGSISFGYNNSSIGQYAFTAGRGNTANYAAFSAGLTNQSVGEYSTSFGNNTVASGRGSTATGGGTFASGVFSNASGYYTDASGNYSHAEGGIINNKVDKTTASGQSSHAEGGGTIAQGNYSHSEGYRTTAYGANSHVEGQNSITGDGVRPTDVGGTNVGQKSHAEGGGTQAYGIGSHSEGGGTLAYGNYSHAENWYSEAYGNNSHVEGFKCSTGDSSLFNNTSSNTSGVSGAHAHAEGNVTWATGRGAHAEGEKTQASGRASHAEGINTIAGGSGSHASGYGCTASGEYSYSGGRISDVTGECTFAHGYYLIGSSNNQAIVGKYNAATNSLFIVGDGTSSSNRRNAFTVNINGTATIRTAPVNAMDVVNKSYVDNLFTNIATNTTIASLIDRISDLEAQLQYQGM